MVKSEIMLTLQKFLIYTILIFKPSHRMYDELVLCAYLPYACGQAS